MAVFLIAISAFAFLPFLAGAEEIYPNDQGSSGNLIITGGMDSQIASMSDQEYADYTYYMKNMVGYPNPGFSYRMVNLSLVDPSGSGEMNIDGMSLPYTQFVNTYDTVEYRDSYLRNLSDNMSDYVADPNTSAFVRMSADGQSVEYVAQKLINLSDPTNADFLLALTFPNNGIADRKAQDTREMYCVVKICLAENDRFGDYHYDTAYRITDWWEHFANRYFLTDGRRDGQPVTLVYRDSSMQRPLPPTEN